MVENVELTLCGGDESIDHHLRTIEEVSKLSRRGQNT